MKLTYKQLLEAAPSLKELLTLSPAPTAKLAVNIARNIRKVNSALSDLDAAKRAIITPYLGEEGQLVGLESEVEKVLEAEYLELLDSDVEVDIHPIKMEDIYHVEETKPGFTIPTQIFFSVDWLFE